jgi:hypothetical protein
MLLHDIDRCHDHGCPECATCARYLERSGGGPQTSHYASLFPFAVALLTPCPSRIAPSAPSEAA